MAEERKTLPQRSTRGKRIQVALEDEDDADEQFWNQEFFAEEQADEDYQSEPEQEDVVDTDFDEEESEESEEGEEVADKPKRKALKPPGAPPARPPKAAAKPPQPARRASTASAAPSPTTPASPSQQDLDLLSAPTLRKSTQRKSAAAVAERLQAEAAKPKRQRVANPEATRQLTQEELLAEAARTELYNLADLRVLQAKEEETKRRAVVVKRKYMGPLVRCRSFAVPLPVPVDQQQQQQQHADQQQPAAAPASAAAAAAAAATGAAEPANVSSVPSTIAAADTQPGATGAADAVMADALSTAREAGSTPPPAPTEAQSAAGDAAAGPSAAGTDAAGAAATPQPAAANEPGPAADAGMSAEHAAAGPLSKPAAPREERTTLMLCNMKAPPRWLRARRALHPPPCPLCAITGQPARYCDPLTGQFYATKEAFRELRRRGGHPVPDAAAKAALRKGRQAAHGRAGASMQGQPRQQPAQEHTEDVMALLLNFAQTQPQ